jgi:hypothetical protein
MRKFIIRVFGNEHEIECDSYVIRDNVHYFTRKDVTGNEIVLFLWKSSLEGKQKNWRRKNRRSN